MCLRKNCIICLQSHQFHPPSWCFHLHFCLVVSCCLNSIWFHTIPVLKQHPSAACHHPVISVVQSWHHLWLCRAPGMLPHISYTCLCPAGASAWELPWQSVRQNAIHTKYPILPKRCSMMYVASGGIPFLVVPLRQPNTALDRAVSEPIVSVLACQGRHWELYLTRLPPNHRCARGYSRVRRALALHQVWIQWHTPQSLFNVSEHCRRFPSHQRPNFMYC